MRFKIGVPLLVIALGFGWWSSRGETNADDLSVGDCFQLPGDEFTEVQDQDCAGIHEAELYAFVNLPVGTAWPGGGSFEVTEAMGEACALASETVDINIENLPADQYIGYFFPAQSEWESTGREVLCYVASPTGLPGPVLAG